MNADEKEMEITLPILQSIEEKSDLTQRSLAKRLGLALGVTNAYLKHCIHKGLVKIEQVPANRYLYYLTPKGLAEKSRLTAQYLSHSFQYYRKASDSCLRLFEQCHARGWNEAILCGISDLAEIALLHSMQAEVSISGIYDFKAKQQQFLNLAVWRDVAQLPEKPVCILTVLSSSKSMHQKLRKITDDERILVPDIMKF